MVRSNMPDAIRPMVGRERKREVNAVGQIKQLNSSNDPNYGKSIDDLQWNCSGILEVTNLKMSGN